MLNLLLAKSNQAYLNRVKKIIQRLEQLEPDYPVYYFCGFYADDKPVLNQKCNHPKNSICLCGTSWEEWNDETVEDLIKKLKDDAYLIERISLASQGIREDLRDVIFVDQPREEFVQQIKKNFKNKK